MALLSQERLMEKAARRAGYRLKTAGTKLNAAEMTALETYCRDKGKTPGEVIRQLILTELAQQDNQHADCGPMLPEIVGVRLLLVNALRSLAIGQTMTPEAFDKLLDQIGTAKHELAGKILAEGRR